MNEANSFSCKPQFMSVKMMLLIQLMVDVLTLHTRESNRHVGKKDQQFMHSLNSNTYGPIRGTKRGNRQENSLKDVLKNEKFESVQCAERKIWRSEFSYKQVGHREALKAAENPPAGR